MIPTVNARFHRRNSNWSVPLGNRLQAIDNAHLYQQAQAERTRAERLIERARAIYQVALTVNSEENLSAVLKIAAQHLVRGLNADGGKIVLLNADMLRLPDTAEQELIQQANAVEPTFALGDLPNFHQAALTGSPCYVTAKQASECERQVFRHLGFSSAMVVPLMTGSNHHSTYAAQNT